jgi:mortality factor 4-like protein 1
MTSSVQIVEYVSNHVIEQWDDWVPQDRVRKFTDENKELAAQLHNQMKALQKQPKSGKKGQGGRANGSDFSSARGSEERTASVAAQSGRGGQRRARDYEIENVSPLFPYCLLSLCLSPELGLPELLA